MAYRENFIQIIREACAELGISVETYSNDWAFRLEKDGKIRYIVGYHFPLNLSSGKELCQDKCLTYSALSAAGIPAVPHLFVPVFKAAANEGLEALRPTMEKWIADTGYVVVKDNYGTGGNQVYRLSTMEEAEEAIQKVFQKSYAASVSPFFTIKEEYRVTMLDGESLQVIRKERKSAVNEKGEKVYLDWRHNLGLGATGILVEDAEKIQAVEPIAIQVMKAMNLRFASVDVVETKEGFFVLEVNAGVMMEHFAGQSPECYEKAKAIYKKAIKKSMEDEL